MKLSEVKEALTLLPQVNFELPDGTLVPQHFHVTEVGLIHKHFIDCGGTVRKQKNISFQLWSADDTHHRLTPEKLLDIISISEKNLEIENLEVEVEYQTTTIGRYDLEFNGRNFLLLHKQTDCLAPDKCGIPTKKNKVSLSELTSGNKKCNPNSGCC